MTRGAPIDQDKKNYYYIKSTNGNLARVLSDAPKLFTQALDYKYNNNIELSLGDLQAIQDYSSKWVNRHIGRKQPIDFDKLSEYLCNNLIKIHSTTMVNDKALNYWFTEMVYIIIHGINIIPDNFFNYYLNNMFTNNPDAVFSIIVNKLTGDQFNLMKLHVMENNYNIDDFIELIKNYVPYMDSYCKKYFYEGLPDDYQIGVVL